MVQVLPVLILALTIESRGLSLRGEHSLERRAVVIGFAITLALAEIAAAVGVWTASQSRFLAVYVAYGGLVALGLVLLVGVIDVPWMRGNAQRPAQLEELAEFVRRAVDGDR